MQVWPDVFGIWAETQCVQIESHCLIILTLECIGNTQVHPHSHVVWSDVQGLVVMLDGFIGPSQMSQSGADLVHEQVVGGVEGERLVEEVNGDAVLTLDEEQDGHGAVDVGVVLVKLQSLVKDVD